MIGGTVIGITRLPEPPDRVGARGHRLSGASKSAVQRRGVVDDRAGPVGNLVERRWVKSQSDVKERCGGHATAMGGNATHVTPAPRILLGVGALGLRTAILSRQEMTNV